MRFYRETAACGKLESHPGRVDEHLSADSELQMKIPDFYGPAGAETRAIKRGFMKVLCLPNTP
jgi:hypothetical protein